MCHLVVVIGLTNVIFPRWLLIDHLVVSVIPFGCSVVVTWTVHMHILFDLYHVFLWLDDLISHKHG